MAKKRVAKQIDASIEIPHAAFRSPIDAKDFLDYFKNESLQADKAFTEVVNVFNANLAAEKADSKNRRKNSKKKTQARQIYEHAYDVLASKDTTDTQDRMQELQVLIEANSHRNKCTGLCAILSAYFAAQNDIDKDACSENCKGGNALWVAFTLGEIKGFTQRP